MIVLEEFPGKRFLISKTDVSRNAGNGNKALEYLSGTIKACNKAPTTAGCKKLKLWIQYDGKGAIEEINPKRLRRQLLIEYVLVEVPKLSKRLPALAFKQLFEVCADDAVIVQHFGTRKIERVPKTSLFPFKFRESRRETVSPAVLDDFGHWLRVQKTKLLLLKGPYSVSPSTVEIYSDADGHKFKALLKCHDTFNRKLIVMENLQSKKVDPMLSEIQFSCSDEELDQMLLGDAPKKHYSRYGKDKIHNIERPSPWHWMPPVWADSSAAQYSRLFSVLKEPMKTSVIKVNPRKSLSSCTSHSSSSSSSSSLSSKQSKKKKQNSFLNASNVEVLQDNSTEDDLRAARLLKYMEIEDFKPNEQGDSPRENTSDNISKDDDVNVGPSNLNQLELLKLLYDASDLSSESAQSTPTKVNTEKELVNADGSPSENVIPLASLEKTVESLLPITSTTTINTCVSSQAADSLPVISALPVITSSNTQVTMTSCATVNKRISKVPEYTESTKYVTEITEEVEYTPPQEDRTGLQNATKVYGKTTITHTICEEVNLMETNKNKPRLSSFQKRKSQKPPVTMGNKIDVMTATKSHFEHMNNENKSLPNISSLKQSYTSPETSQSDKTISQHNFVVENKTKTNMLNINRVEEPAAKPNKRTPDEMLNSDNPISSFKDMARLTYFRDKSFLLKEPQWGREMQSWHSDSLDTTCQNFAGNHSQQSCKAIEVNSQNQISKKKKNSRRNNPSLLRILNSRSSFLEYKSIGCLQRYLKRNKISARSVQTLLDAEVKNSRAECFYRSLLIADSLPRLPKDNTYSGDISLEDPSFDWPLIYAKLQSFYDLCYSELARCQETQGNVHAPQSVNFIQNFTVNVLPNESSPLPFHYSNNHPMILPSHSATKQEFSPPSYQHSDYHNTCNSALLPNYAHSANRTCSLDYHRLNNLLPEGYHVPDFQIPLQVPNLIPNQATYCPWPDVMHPANQQSLSARLNPPLPNVKSNTPMNQSCQHHQKISSSFSTNAMQSRKTKESMELNETLDDEFLESILSKSENTISLDNLLDEEFKLPIKTETPKTSSQSKTKSPETSQKSNAVTVIMKPRKRGKTDSPNKSTDSKHNSSDEVEKSTDELFNIAVTNYITQLYRTNVLNNSEQKNFVQTKPPLPKDEIQVASNSTKATTLSSSKKSKSFTIDNITGITPSIIHPKNRLAKSQLQKINNASLHQGEHLEKHATPVQNQTVCYNAVSTTGKTEPHNLSFHGNPADLSSAVSNTELLQNKTEATPSTIPPKPKPVLEHEHTSLNQNTVVQLNDLFIDLSSTVSKTKLFQNKTQAMSISTVPPTTTATTSTVLSTSLHENTSLQPKPTVLEDEHIEKELPHPTDEVASKELVPSKKSSDEQPLKPSQVANKEKTSDDSRLCKVFKITDSVDYGEIFNVANKVVKDDGKLENERVLKCFVVSDSHENLFEMVNTTSHSTTSHVPVTLPITSHKENDLSSLTTTMTLSSPEEDQLSSQLNKVTPLKEKEDSMLLSTLPIISVKENNFSQEQNKPTALQAKDLTEISTTFSNKSQKDTNKVAGQNIKKRVSKSRTKKKLLPKTDIIRNCAASSIVIRKIIESTAPDKLVSNNFQTIFNNQSIPSPNSNPDGEKTELFPKISTIINPMISNVKTCIAQTKTSFKVTDILFSCKPGAHNSVNQFKVPKQWGNQVTHQVHSSQNTTGYGDSSYKETTVPNNKFDNITESQINLNILEKNLKDNIEEVNAASNSQNGITGDPVNSASQLKTTPSIVTCRSGPSSTLSKNIQPKINTAPSLSVILENQEQLTTSSSCILANQVQLTTSLSAILGNQVQLTTSSPGILVNQPKLVTSSSGVLANQPQLTSSLSDILANQPKLTTSFSGILANQVQLTTSSDILAKQPKLTSSSSAILVNQPKLISSSGPNKYVIKVPAKELSNMLSQNASTGVQNPMYLQMTSSSSSKPIILIMKHSQTSSPSRTNIKLASQLSPTEIKLPTVWQDRQCKSLPTSPVTIKPSVGFPMKKINPQGTLGAEKSGKRKKLQIKS